MTEQTILAGKLSIYWGYIILASFLTCAGNLCIKQSRLTGDGLVSPYFFLGLLFFSINFIVFSRALDELPISTAYPVFASLGFILIAVFSSLLFQESLSLKQWFGMVIVLIGLGCMTK